MITHETLRNLTRLSCDEAISRKFSDLVAEYLSNSTARMGSITDELYLLIALCNHHRQVLDRIYRKDRMADARIRTWIHELATPPAGEWSELRLSLAPLIRTFGQPPRPKGSRLFSPMRISNPEGDRSVPEQGSAVRIGLLMGGPVD